MTELNEPLFGDAEDAGNLQEDSEQQSLLDDILSSLEEDLLQEQSSVSEPTRPEDYSSSRQSAQENSQKKSAVLESLPNTWRPPKECACVECPSALWHRSRDTVKCYCGRLFAMTYESKKGHADTDMIVDCDGLSLGQGGE